MIFDNILIDFNNNNRKGGVSMSSEEVSVWKTPDTVFLYLKEMVGNICIHDEKNLPKDICAWIRDMNLSLSKTDELLRDIEKMISVHKSQGERQVMEKIIFLIRQKVF